MDLPLSWISYSVNVLTFFMNSVSCKSIYLILEFHIQQINCPKNSIIFPDVLTPIAEIQNDLLMLLQIYDTFVAKICIL